MSLDIHPTIEQVGKINALIMLLVLMYKYSFEKVWCTFQYGVSIKSFFFINLIDFFLNGYANEKYSKNVERETAKRSLTVVRLSIDWLIDW